METAKANAERAKAETDRAREEVNHEKAKIEKTKAETAKTLNSNWTEAAKSSVAFAAVCVTAVGLFMKSKKIKFSNPAAKRICLRRPAYLGR